MINRIKNLDKVERTLLTLLLLASLLLIGAIILTKHGDVYTREGTVDSVEVANTVFTPIGGDYSLAVRLTDGTYLILPRGEKVNSMRLRFTIRPVKVLGLWDHDEVIGVESIE